MAQAHLRVEVGPCDDDGYFFFNGSPAVSVRLGQTRTVQRQLDDGAYDMRFLVINSGGWAWKSKLRVTINGEEVWAVDRTGGSGFYNGPVFDESSQFTLTDGKIQAF